MCTAIARYREICYIEMKRDGKMEDIIDEEKEMIKKIILIMSMSLSLHANCPIWQDELYERYIHCLTIDADLVLIENNLFFIKNEENKDQVELMERTVEHARSILFGDMNHPYD